jgi:hypothetical protein
MAGYELVRVSWHYSRRQSKNFMAAYEDFMELHNNQGRKQDASSKKSQMYDAGDV